MTIDSLNSILAQKEFSKQNLIDLLSDDDPKSVQHIFKFADKVRIACCGESVHLRGVIELSNYCEQDCMYCSLREENFSIRRFRMTPDEAMEAARQIVKSGIYTIVLQTGEDSELDTDILAYLIYSIKKTYDVALTLSLGERQLDEYKAWKIAGADRYILKHETCSEKEYSFYRKKKFLTDRIQNLKYLKRLGYQIGSGNIVGLPNQTIETIVDDILLMREMNVDIVDISNFYPYPFTPFQNLPKGDLILTLKTIALSRIVLKDVHIHAVTPRGGTRDKNFVDGLKCGANALLTDFTPQKYRDEEQMRPGEPYTQTLKSTIESEGRSISFSKGDSLKNHRTISF